MKRVCPSVLLLIALMFLDTRLRAQDAGDPSEVQINDQVITMKSAGLSSHQDDKWWAAQRNIETAIAQLQIYLQESTSGEHLETARQQLQVLQGLTINSLKPQWVQLCDGLYGRTDWRITSVDPQPAKTRVTIEIRNRDNQNENFFYSFDTSPLVLIDNNGEYYPMVYTSPPPIGIKVQQAPFSSRNIEAWYLQGARVISVIVDFAPLAKGVASGQVQYKDGNSAEPAKFSLSILKR